MSRARSRFHPRLVPEVRNGYYWLAKDAINLGATSFVIPEGNKHPLFNLIQSTVLTQPAALTENGQKQFRFSDSAEANPSRVAASGTLVAGWTGPTMVSGWFRLPDAAADITGTSVFFGHRTNTTNRRLILGTSSTGDVLTFSISTDGSTVSITNFPSPLTVDFKYCEWIFDPLNTLSGTTDADRTKLFTNFVMQTRSADATTLPGVSLHESTANLFLCSTSATTSGADRLDWGGTLFYTNGIPSIKNRKRLANYLSPLNTKFSIAV